MNVKVIVTVLSSLLAVSVDALPRKVFEEYHQRLSDGMTYESEMSFYTDFRKREIGELIRKFTVEERLPENQIKFRYSQRAQDEEDCKELTFEQESTLGRKSMLTYLLSNTCQSGASEATQSVEMIYQGGWKINKIEIRY